MTSGPMPINALPPELQPDPQPDRQIVAWMQAHRTTLDPRMHPSDARVETVRAYRNANREKAMQVGLRALVDAYNEAARKPVTVADIPAGQGAASLFLMTRHRPGSTRSHWQLIYKREDGTLAPQVTPAGPEDAVFAVLQHLAATLPTIDTTEESA